MKKLLFIALVWFSLSPVAGWADDVFIGNKPFKGQIYGVGNEIRFSIVDLAKQLNIQADQTSEGWFLGGQKIEVTEEHGVVWVDIDDLPTTMVRVVRNKEFGTIDLYRVEGQAGNPDNGTWGGRGTLVFFGASWCPTTAAMRPTITEIEQSQFVHVVYVDVEAMESPAYKQYDFLFEGDKIPFFVLLDDRGRRIHSFFGFRTYSEMLSTLNKYVK